MASGLPVASRTRARIRKEDSFAERFSKAEPGRQKGESSGAKRRGRPRKRVSPGTQKSESSGPKRKGRPRKRVSSISGALGGRGGGSAGDDSHEVVVITDGEDGSDKTISVSGSGEEEEESGDYRPQTARRFEPIRVFHKCRKTAVVADGRIDSDEEDSTDFKSDGSVGGHENRRFRGDKFLYNACSDDDLLCSDKEKALGEQGEGNGRSFKSKNNDFFGRSKNDDYAPNVSRKRTPSVTDDGHETYVNLDYLSSSSTRSTEADNTSDEDFIANVQESLSADGETSSGTEEYVSGTECEDILEIRKKIKNEDELSSLYRARETTRELDSELIDNAEKKEDEERRVSWVNEWLQDDVEEEKEEEAINVEHDIECMDNPVIDDVRRKENVEFRVLWVNEWLLEELKGEEANNAEQLNAEIDCPSNDENGRVQEKRHGKHVQSDFDSVIRYATSSKVEGRKERNSGMSCSIRQLQKKRKYEDCSSEKAFVNKIAEQEQASASNGTMEEERKVIELLGEQATGIRSGAEPVMQLRTASETLSKPCKVASTNAANSSIGHHCKSNKKAVRNDCRGNWESRTRRERACESRENTLSKLADCIWGKDEILQDNIQKESEKEKQFAGDCAVEEERNESTEGFETFGTTASNIKRDCSNNMYELKKVGQIMTKSDEEGVGVHQEKVREDCSSTSDYHIRWERSGSSKELKYFKRPAQKFRDNKDDAGRKEVVWETASRIEPRVEVPPLPVKFFWGDEEPEPAPKSEAEKEMDKMWSQMEFYLRAGEIGSSGPLEKFSIETSGTKMPLNRGDVSLSEEDCLQPSGDDSDKLSHQNGSVLDLIPCDSSKMYPHQLEGFEFMWKNIAGSTDLKDLSNSEPNDVGGCIISHAPGTGKTCMTILFLHTYLRLFPNSRPVVIAPASLLLTWEEEFKKWNKKWDTSILFHNLNNPEFSGAENPEAVRMVEANSHLKRCSDVMRVIKVYSWSKNSSILGISYNLYEKLAVHSRKGTKDPVKKAKIEKKDEEMRKILLDLPGVVVLDEGHTPRNQRSSIWKLLLKLRTEKRIILSGTPFQNNFLELYNTLCLVRPTMANELPLSLKKFCQTTQWKRAKTDDINSLVQPHDKVADDAIVNLRSIMAPFVHVHKGSILKENLPGIKECIVVLNPGDRQKKIVENIQRSQCTFEYEFKLSLACIHPSLILSCNAYANEKPLICHERQKLEDLKTHTDAGIKTRFLVELIRLSEALGEKVLVFSQYKEPLSFISDQLRLTFQWSSQGKELLHMHGSLNLRERQRLIGKFNNPQSQARVMLASTKACSEGISLVGASRVVLLDVVWNPSVERQAISRAFRIGQEKVVYTYHLIMKGTSECNKFNQQMEKERLSKLFFSPADKEIGDGTMSSLVAEDRILEEMTSSKNLKDMFDQILYQPKDSNAFENFDSDATP
ncbi:hypothetical protein ACJRO7_020423 [Eucalyptus globulus]|uniref:Uncharacterized protein n=1 Tax=Eucalyptus globulus TaxID=34317 RepID=A0ABD3KI39_EUCGL